MKCPDYLVLRFAPSEHIVRNGPEVNERHDCSVPVRTHQMQTFDLRRQVFFFEQNLRSLSKGA